MNQRVAGPKDMGDIVAGAFNIYRRAPGRWLALTLVTLVAVFSLQLLIATQVDLASDTVTDDISGNPLLAVAMIVGSVLSGVITHAAVVAAAGRQLRGEPVSVGAAYAVALRRLWPLILDAAIIVIVAITAITFIITIPLAIFFPIRWSFFTQAIVIEGDGAMAALRRSQSTVSRQWWRTFGISVAILLLSILPAIALGPIVAPFDTDWVTSLGAAIASAIAAPFTGLAQTLLYDDLRQRKGERPLSEAFREVP